MYRHHHRLGMDTAKWERIFDKFFRRAVMVGSYKPVLLDALVDAACCYGKEKQIKRGWIKPEDGKILLSLDFIAAKFAVHYWEVYPFVFRHMAGGSSSKDKQDHDIRMVRLIGKHSKDRPHEIPGLEELAGSKMNKLRRDIIQLALRPHVLKKLAKDLDYSYDYKPRDDYITLDGEFVEYMRLNSKQLKKRIQSRLESHINKRNKKYKPIISKSNPFCKYIENQITTWRF